MVATWIFGTASFLFIVGVFLFSPPELPPYKVRVLAIVSAILLGFFGFFFSGTLTIGVDGDWPLIGKVALQASGGIALFLITMYWWKSEFAPVKAGEPLPPDVRAALEKQVLDNLPMYQVDDKTKQLLLGNSLTPVFVFTTSRLCEKAEQSISTENYEQAIHDCDKALELQPDLLWANLIRAEACLSAGKYEQAIKDSSLLINRFPDAGRPYLLRLAAYFASRQFENALNDATKLCDMGDCRHLRNLENSLKELKQMMNAAGKSVKEFEQMVAGPEYAKAIEDALNRERGEKRDNLNK
jgi:hypothetical protein